MRALVLILAGTSLFAAGARADIVVPGADGSDGAFSPTSSVVVDLSLAATGTWDGPNTSPGNGVYDPEKWAVVFRYSSVNVPSGVTVTFLNHPSGAPVVWLVSGGATIAGTVSLDGQSYRNDGVRTTPGPGGFPGGKQRTVTGWGRGAGPGGGNHSSNSGQPGVFATGSGSYGNSALLPLIGGSGGSGDDWTEVRSGAAGGGAILIASNSSIAVANSGVVRARGGAGYAYNSDSNHWSGSGAGGAIRLVADSVTVGGSVNAEGGQGGHWGGSGRIRIEANTIQGNGPINPSASTAVAGSTALIWADDLAPRIRVTSIGTAPVPADPSPRLPTSDVDLDVTNPITITIAAENVPTDWNMSVRVTPIDGSQQTASAVFVSGDLASSIWQAQITVPIGKSAVQVRASAP